jgi:hypothetical protein
MSTSRDLPVEIWRDVLMLLPRADQKSFRLASKYTAGLATPLLFETVFFDLEPGGCDSLARIAQGLHLRGHVRILQLQRRAGIGGFGDFDAWHDANIYEYKPWSLESDSDEPSLDKPIQPLLDTPVQPSLDEGLMSKDEWTTLREEQRNQLYESYKADLATQNRSLKELAHATSDWLLCDSNLGRFLPTQLPTACPALALFMTAVTALNTVQRLIHVPTFHLDSWCRIWRSLEFHPDALLELGFGDDPHAEALQVFIALLGVLAAPNALRSVELYTLEHAFWTMDNLRRLLFWDEYEFGPKRITRAYGSMRWSNTDVDDWIEKHGGSRSALRRMADLTRIVGEIERRFSRLTGLTYYIDTLWDEPKETPILSDQTLFRTLQAAQHLTDLSMTYRDDAHESGAWHYTFYDSDHKIRRPSSLKMSLFHAQASKRLLVDAISALSTLRRLHLSCLTGVAYLLSMLSRLRSLRSLSLTQMTLFYQKDGWEYVFRWIAQTLRLEDVRLLNLEDFDGKQPRLMLCPTWPAWNVDDSRKSYSGYERAIYQFVLRQRDDLVPLIAEAYLELHSPLEGT